MPRELTHWLIAGEAADRLPVGRLSDAIRAHRDVYLLGAVAPDSPFYALIGRQHDVLQRVASAVHGADGRDTLGWVPDSATAVGWAFIAGVCTHIAADAVFHPFVYYFSGSWKAEDPRVRYRATIRHVRLETAIDEYHVLQRPVPHGGRMDRLLAAVRRAEVVCGSHSGLLAAARHLYSQYTLAQRSPAADSAARGWARIGLLSRAPHTGSRFVASGRHALVGWRWHGLLQRLYFPPWFRAFLQLLDCLPSFQMQMVLAMGYRFPAGRRYPRFDSPFAYRHPVTGEWRVESLSELRARVLDYVLQLLAQVEERLNGRHAAMEGPSLETGIAGPGQRMRYFDVQTVEQLLRAPAPSGVPNVAVY